MPDKRTSDTLPNSIHEGSTISRPETPDRLKRKSASESAVTRFAPPLDFSASSNSFAALAETNEDFKDIAKLGTTRRAAKRHRKKLRDHSARTNARGMSDKIDDPDALVSEQVAGVESLTVRDSAEGSQEHKSLEYDDGPLVWVSRVVVFFKGWHQ